MVLSIGIVEDDETLRNSLVDYISLRGNTLAFACDTVQSVPELKKKTDSVPDMILLDEHLGGTSGISSLAAIKKKFPTTFVIIMTGDTTQDLIIKAIENGAAGFLYKPFSLKQIDEVARNLIETGSYLHPLSATKLIATIQSGKATEEQALSKLSAKEAEIAQLLIVGKTYKEIALLLNKSFHTVNYHIKNMYAKFDANSKTELVYKLGKKNKR